MTLEMRIEKLEKRFDPSDIRQIAGCVAHFGTMNDDSWTGAGLVVVRMNNETDAQLKARVIEYLVARNNSLESMFKTLAEVLPVGEL